MFRSIIIVVLLIFLENSESLEGSVEPKILSLVKPIQNLRWKRELDNGCMEDCDKDLELNFDTYLPDGEKIAEKLGIDPVTYFPLNQNQFATVCKNIYKPYNQCVSTCPNTGARRLAENLFLYASYMCIQHYNEFYDSIPCVRNIKNETVSVCLDDVCQENKGASQKFISAMKNEDDEIPDFSELKNLLADSCKLMKCEGQCGFEIMERRCGSDVTKLHKNFDNLALSSVKTLYDGLGIGQVLWPNECNIQF